MTQAISNTMAAELSAPRAARETDRSVASVAAADGPPDEHPAAGPEHVAAAVDRINATVQSLVSHLEFMIDTDTQRTVVKVIDNRTSEVLRQFPSEEVLNIAKALDKFTGLLLNEKA